MSTLDSKLLKRLLSLAADRLKGDWLLLGGTLLPAVGLDIRSTVDIDLIGLGDSERAQDLDLMELAEELGLGAAVINQAAAYFAKKLGVKESDMILLVEGKKARIFRPTAEFYIRSKLKRLSEADLMDCQHYFNFCLSKGDRVNQKKIKGFVLETLKDAHSEEKQKRLHVLLSLVS